MKSLPWSRGFTVSLVVGALLACSGVRSDEFICENAVSHLQRCCPGFDAPIDCSYSQGCESSTYPAIDSVQGDCILGESCAALRAAGVCERAAHFPSTGLEADGSSPPVCTGSSPLGAGTGSGDAGLEFECTSTRDCNGGLVCCAVNDPARANFECMTWPCQSGFQSCATSSECEPGRTCEPSGNAPAVGFCVAVDASSDASSGDAMTDARSSVADGADGERGDGAGTTPEGSADSGDAQAALDALADATDASISP